MSKTLRFWVECEYADREELHPEKVASEAELLEEILRDFEARGDAMRYLNRKGRIAWKATPRMLERLADAEREAQADMQEWP
jgi:hypothetical protein